MTEQEKTEHQEWIKETLEMATPIMERLDGACPYYTVVVTPRGATLVIDEWHEYNPKYDPRNQPNDG